jgi:hypothetical protein
MAVQDGIMREIHQVQSNSSQQRPEAVASPSADHEALDISPSQSTSLEAQRLQLILNALETLNSNMVKMEHHLSEMVSQGVKVKWLK